MQAKRFIAADMRRALDMVKQEFGEDAMIISTERTNRGVELLASTEKPVETLLNDFSTSQSAANQTLASSPAPSHTQSRSATLPTPQASGTSAATRKEQLAYELEIANRKMQAARQAESVTLESWAQSQDIPSQNTPPNNTNTSVPMQQPSAKVEQAARQNDQEIRRLHHEIADMRDTIEHQLSYMAQTQERQFIESQQNPNSPSAKAVDEIKYRLESLGLSNSVTTPLLRAINEEKMPIDNRSRLWTHVLASISKHIPADTSDPISRGGVYAFLGTTGVGKTTTIAKLAARYVMENGPENVVLLTTDTYRIASHNQLRSLARILNVRVEVVDELDQLPNYLERLSNSDLVLIDTPGMGHADPALKTHLRALRRCAQISNFLVLSANSQYQMLKASLHSYRLAGLDYCVMTKVDECAGLGDMLSVLYEHELPLGYMTDGQAVPEDISTIKSSQVVSKAVTMLQSQRRSDLLAQTGI